MFTFGDASASSLLLTEFSFGLLRKPEWEMTMLGLHEAFPAGESLGVGAEGGGADRAAAVIDDD